MASDYKSSESFVFKSTFSQVLDALLLFGLNERKSRTHQSVSSFNRTFKTLFNFSTKQVINLCSTTLKFYKSKNIVLKLWSVFPHHPCLNYIQYICLNYSRTIFKSYTKLIKILMDNPLHKDMMIVCVFTYVTILKRTYHQIYGKSDSTTSHIKRSMLINGNTKKKHLFS